MKQTMYDVFDDTKRYYVRGIYCMKTEIQKKDLCFRLPVKKQPEDVVKCCWKCT